MIYIILFLFLKEDFIYLFLERGSEKEREERNINVWFPLTHPMGGLARNPGMCPDWELNQRPFDSQADTQSTEPNQPGLFLIYYQ